MTATWKCPVCRLVAKSTPDALTTYARDHLDQHHTERSRP